MRKYLTVSITMVFLIVSILAALSLSSCSSPKSKLVGKWQITDEKEVSEKITIEFFSDNKYSSNFPYLGSGNWSILDDGRVNLEAKVMGTSIIYTGKIEGDILELSLPNTKETMKYKKMK